MGGILSNSVEWEAFLRSNSWHSCSMWEKRGWFNRFWQYLCEGSSFKVKGFGYSYAWSCSLREGRTFFCMVPISRKLSSFLLMSLALLHSVSYFFFLYRSPSLSLCTIYTISSNISRFSQSTHLLIFLCLGTLMSIARIYLFYFIYSLF